MLKFIEYSASYSGGRCGWYPKTKRDEMTLRVVLLSNLMVRSWRKQFYPGYFYLSSKQNKNRNKQNPQRNLTFFLKYESIMHPPSLSTHPANIPYHSYSTSDWTVCVRRSVTISIHRPSCGKASRGRVAQSALPPTATLPCCSEGETLNPSENHHHLKTHLHLSFKKIWWLQSRLLLWWRPFQMAVDARENSL